MRASQPLCSEAAGCWPNSECHSEKMGGNEAGGVQDLERLVIGPGSSRLVSNTALFKQVERKAGERSQGACVTLM